MATAVLIPGLVSDARIWRAVAQALPSGLQRHDADLRNMTGITAAAQDLLGSVSGDLIVAGHSMGGRIALEMARIAPGRIRALILANTGHGPRRDGEEPGRQKKIDLGHQSMERLATEWLPPMLAPGRDTDAALMADLRDMVLRAGPDLHERQIRALLARPDAGRYLADIRCPVLLITGRQDGWSPITQHEEIAAAVTDAELAVIEDAGHFAPVEQPQDVCAAVIDWLQRKGLAA